MLNSLFGELGLIRLSEWPSLARTPAASRPSRLFAAKSMVETQSSRLNEVGEVVDRQVRDLFVTGSAAEAMREHFAATGGAEDGAARMITLFDPARLWAPGVIKALSDAGGQPVERLNLRDHASLRTLATIERTAIQPAGETIKIYHADVGSPDLDGADVAMALLERSDLATVIVGRLHPHTIDTLLENLRHAASQPTWHCRTLLFMLPPAAAWMANKVAGVAWPQALRVVVLNEPMTSASAVWNSLLAMWNQVKRLDAFTSPEDTEAAAPDAVLAVPLAGLVHSPEPPSQQERIEHALLELRRTDGLLACALVDRTTGAWLDQQLNAADVGLDACARAGLAHWQSMDTQGLPPWTGDAADELIFASAQRDVVTRVAGAQGQWLLVSVFDRQRAHPVLSRQRVAEAQAALAD
jgi:hypothetical protein